MAVQVEFSRCFRVYGDIGAQYVLDRYQAGVSDEACDLGAGRERKVVEFIVGSRLSPVDEAVSRIVGTW